MVCTSRYPQQHTERFCFYRLCARHTRTRNVVATYSASKAPTGVFSRLKSLSIHAPVYCCTTELQEECYLCLYSYPDHVLCIYCACTRTPIIFPVGVGIAYVYDTHGLRQDYYNTTTLYNKYALPSCSLYYALCSARW